MNKNTYIILLKRLAFALLFYPCTRGLFYLLNQDYFKSSSVGDLVIAFLYGLRFDVSTVLIANVFFIILSVLPLRGRAFNFTLKFIFVLFNFFFLVINIIDAEFFSFIGKKITFDIFDMSSDIAAQSTQLISYYWYLALVSFIILSILIKFYPTHRKNILYVTRYSPIKGSIFSFLFLVLTFIGIRGGVQLRSISPKQAFIFDNYELGNLSLGAAYTVARTIGKKPIANIDYFSNDIEAIKSISRDFSFTDFVLPKKQNVVVIILESFSLEYVEQGYTPFLSELISKSLYFSKNFANGRRSLEALPSILSGFPSLIGKPIYQSQFQSNRFVSLPQILKNSGYSTSFFHGGKRGTMDFDAYCKSIGVEDYYALEDYPNQEHFDGHWGIYDHHYLNYFSTELAKNKEPFFSTIFTLSSHQPYAVPKKMKKLFTPGTLEIHESIQYVDRALKDFFDRSKNMAWFENTLFVITADHTQKLETDMFANQLGHYRVPLLFYHPKVDLTILNRDRISQHADILPTVADLLGIELDEKLLFGSSLLNNDKGLMLNYIGGNFLYLDNNHFIRYDGQNAKFFKTDSSLTKMVPYNRSTNDKTSASSLNQLKAYIQYSINGLKKNKLYVE